MLAKNTQIIACATAFFALYACVVSPDTMLGRELPVEKKQARSNFATVGAYQYQITFDGSTLHLVGSSDADMYKTRLPGLTHSTVTEIRIAPWANSSLCAIYECRVDGRYEYYCITFLSKTDGRVDGKRHFRGKIADTKRNQSVLALNGTLDGDTILAVIGEMSVKSGRMTVPKGLLYLDNCPQPPGPNNVTEFVGALQSMNSNR